MEYEKVYDDRKSNYQAKEVTGGANEGDEPGGGGGGGGGRGNFGPNGHDYRRDDDGSTRVDEEQVNRMLADRLQAKMSRDFPTADRIRDDLRGMGVEVYVRSASPAFFPLSQKPAACFLPAPASCFSLRANTRRRIGAIGAVAAVAAAA